MALHQRGRGRVRSAPFIKQDAAVLEEHDDGLARQVNLGVQDRSPRRRDWPSTLTSTVTCWRRVLVPPDSTMVAGSRDARCSKWRFPGVGAGQAQARGGQEHQGRADGQADEDVVSKWIQTSVGSDEARAQTSFGSDGLIAGARGRGREHGGGRAQRAGHVTIPAVLAGAGATRGDMPTNTRAKASAMVRPRVAECNVSVFGGDPLGALARASRGAGPPADETDDGGAGSDQGTAAQQQPRRRCSGHSVSLDMMPANTAAIPPASQNQTVRPRLGPRPDPRARSRRGPRSRHWGVVMAGTLPPCLQPCRTGCLVRLDVVGGVQRDADVVEAVEEPALRRGVEREGRH